MKHVCRRCVKPFSSEQVLSNHIESCKKQTSGNVGCTYKDHIKFEDHHVKVQVPFRIYADFECINQPMTDNLNDNVLIQTNYSNCC